MPSLIEWVFGALLALLLSASGLLDAPANPSPASTTTLTKDNP